MEKPRLLILSLIVALASSTRGTELDLPSVELNGATELSDGFRVKVEASNGDARRTGESQVVPGVDFVIWVPGQVRRTYFSIIFLDVEGEERGTFLQITPSYTIDNGKIRCEISAERKWAAQCVLHFQYKARRSDRTFVKDYVVRLRDYLPKRAKP
jgi:hypothetical protein